MKKSGAPSFELVDNETEPGLQVRLCGPVDSAAMDALLDPKIKYVQLHYRKGWTAPSVDFLSQFQQIETLSIETPEAIDLLALSSLRNVRSLYLDCPNPTARIDFADIPSLRFLRLRWGRGWHHDLCAPQIERLMLLDYNGVDLQGLELDSLVGLNIYSAKALKTLEGIQKSSRLRDLLLFRCRQLRKVDHCIGLALQEIEIESCGSVEDLSALLRIPTLTRIVIEKCGPIASMAGANHLRRLRELRIVDTEIRDPDLSALAYLKADLQDCSVFFTNKRHYSHRHVYDRLTGRFAIQEAK